MSPASNIHGHIQFEIGATIKEAKKRRGKLIIECSIQTSQGVKVADVRWHLMNFLPSTATKLHTKSPMKSVLKSCHRRTPLARWKRRLNCILPKELREYGLLLKTAALHITTVKEKTEKFGMLLLKITPV